MVNGKRVISILGSTGSIGVNTLDVIAQHPGRFEVYALAANASVDAMLAQCLAFTPRYAVMMDEAAATLLRQRLPAESVTDVKHGESGLADVVTAPEVDLVMAAIVGAAGSAFHAGRRARWKNSVVGKQRVAGHGRAFVDAGGA